MPEEVNYVLLTGPQGAERTLTGYPTEAAMMAAVVAAEDRGEFCYGYALEHLHYSTEGAA